MISLLNRHRISLCLALITTLASACNASLNAETDRDGNPTADTDSGGAAEMAEQAANSSATDDGPDPKQSSCDAERSGIPRLRRLSHWEYDNSVADLLGVDLRPGQDFVADAVVQEFDNNAGALIVTPLLADQWASAAEHLASEALPKLLAQAPCDAAAGDATCAKKFIERFGKRAFRRPLSDTEVERYLTLYDVGAQDGGFAAGIELLVTTMLQSANFLYRAELGELSDDVVELDVYEVASQLSYMLTGSLPDEELLAAADSGELLSTAAVHAQAERLLGSSRGRAQFARFIHKWLSLDRLDSVPKDATLFPDFDTDIRQAMLQEVDRLATEIAFTEQGTLAQLLTAEYTFVNDSLAAFYGMPAPSSPGDDGFGRVEAPDPARHGVLTLGAVVTTHGRPDGTSPIHRGKMIRERLLCQNLAPPPPGIVVQPPAVDPGLSTRERYSQHSSESVCRSCHQLIDPIGFAFEHLDGVGRYREDEEGHEIDASGEIVGSALSDAAFDGTAALTHLLAGSEDVQTCFALQWFRFAYGEDRSPSTGCAIDTLQENFVASSGTLRDLMLTLATAPILRKRLPVGQPEAPTADGETADGKPNAAEGQAADGSTVDPSTAEEDTDEDSADPANATSPGIAQQVVTDSMWESGRCVTVFLHNESEQEVTWEITLDVGGSLTNNWNSSADGTTDSVTFTGAAHNQTLSPFAKTDFGYCVSF